MRRTSSEAIYDTLKEEIIFLRRKPGEEIDQDEISERFEVSRSPVRDALMRLRSDALVVMRPQRGCWVSRIDLGRVDDECFFRLALEKSVIDRYREYMKPSDITRLEYFIALQKEAAEASDPVAFYNADDDMHSIFFEATKLTRIWNLVQRETGNHRRVRILSMGSKDVLEKNIAQHEELIEALRLKDFALAVTLETEHLSKLKYQTDVLIEEHPEYFMNRKEEYEIE